MSFVLETGSTGQARADAAADVVRQEFNGTKGKANGFALLDSNVGLLVPKYLVRTAQTAPANPTGSNQWHDYIDSADQMHKTRSTTGQVKRHTWDLGSGTSFPAPAQRGDTFFHTTLGLHVFTVGQWRQAEPFLTTNFNGRVAIAGSSATTSLMHDHFRLYESDTGRMFVWDAGLGRFVKVGGPPEVVYENGNFGSSGVLGVGALTTVSVADVTMPCSSDLGQVNYEYAVNTAGNSIFTFQIELYENTSTLSETYAKVHNTGTVTGAGFGFNIPKHLSSVGNMRIVIKMQVNSGANLQLAASALRITF